MQGSQPQVQERLEEYNLEDLHSTNRKEDAGLIAKPVEKKTVVMKEIIKEEPREELPMDDISQQQRSSELRDNDQSPGKKGKGAKPAKAVKFNQNEENEEEDVNFIKILIGIFFLHLIQLDAETIKIAKQIKALKEGKQQGEIKISLKGEGISTVETKLPRAKTENPVKNPEHLRKKNSEDHGQSGQAEEEDEQVQPMEESKEVTQHGPRQETRNSAIQVFHNFEAIRDLKEFLIK